MPRQSPQDGDLLLVEAGSRILELWQPAQDRILFSEANLASCALRDSHSSQQITKFPSEDSHSQQSPISRPLARSQRAIAHFGRILAGPLVAVQPALVVAIAWPGCGEHEVDPLADRGGDERRCCRSSYFPV